MKGLEANLETCSIDGILIVRVLNRRLDAAIAPDFMNRMRNLLENNRGSLVINLQEVDALDSTGLGTLVYCMKKLKGETCDTDHSDNSTVQARHYVICGINRTIMTLFELTRMDRVFTLAIDEDEAVNMIRNLIS